VSHGKEKLLYFCGLKPQKYQALIYLRGCPGDRVRRRSAVAQLFGFRVRNQFVSKRGTVR
jgi:hypothetical protein